MLDEKDLQAIAQMMDTKLEEMKSVMVTKSDLAAQKVEILAETTHNMNVLMENVVTPRFNLLADGQQAILEKLIPRDRIDELEDEGKLLKTVVRQMSEDLQALKKVN